MQARELIDEARRQLGDLAGVQADTVSALDRGADDTWVVTLEAVELTRVPETMDLLATYQVTLASDGRLIGFRRISRYERGLTG